MINNNYLMSRFSQCKPEERNLYFQEYRNKHRKKLREYNRKYNKQWRKKNGYHNEKNSKLRYPEKERARNILIEAVLSGKVKRKRCEKCGKIRAQGHHDDYTNPLKVRWLCALHHNEFHKKLFTS